MDAPTTPRPDATVGSTWWAVLPLLVPPVAWVTSLGMSWAVQDFTCTASLTAGAPAPGTALLITLLAMNATLLLVTAASGVLSVRMQARGRRAGSSLTGFMGATGTILALFFGFGIVLIGATPLLLEVC